MDFGIIHSIYTVAVLVIFLGIVVWAYSSKRTKAFNEAANLVFADEQDGSRCSHVSPCGDAGSRETRSGEEQQ